MRSDHIKRWMETAQKIEKEKEMAEKEAATTTERVGMTDNSKTLEAQKETAADNWTRVVDLFQLAFWEGKLT